MIIRHTVIAAAMLTAALAGCNKRDEAPATPPPAESANYAASDAGTAQPAIADTAAGTV